jgi:hypothetical protein
MAYYSILKMEAVLSFEMLVNIYIQNTRIQNTLQHSPYIIRMMESRRTKLARHVARMGRRGILTGLWLGSQKEGDY